MKRKSYTKEFKTKVAIEAIKGQKTVNEIASEYGVHISQINSWKERLLEAAAEIFSRGRDHEVAAQEAERDRLYRKIGWLQVEVDWLKEKDRTSRLSLAQKRHCIEPEHRQLSVARQCALIGLSCSSYYRQGEVSTESKENLAVMRLIDEEYTRRPFYGSRKMCDGLRCQGYQTNRKRVQRLMAREKA